ncbi:MAG TPA: SPFH domain-containing protein [Fimbriimonadaceae bacterium]|nr:SPFH domain-containing protein [Fimbriimonadaceae bacterium]
MTAVLVIIGVVVAVGLLAVAAIKNLYYNCAPNEVLIFSGGRRRVGERLVGYRLVKGGGGLRVPLLERVDRMDLTNIVIDLAAQNAYSKGGVALTVLGVANVKIAGHEPLLNNAIERFLGRNRAEIMAVAKATLEGSLRGILATLTPEQVNEDRNLFAERLVQEVEQDMTQLGLVVDTLKIQNVSDDLHYLDSIGRKRNAELISSARIAESIAKADAVVATAQNREREVQSQITAQIEVAKAEANRRLTDALTRRDALVAEELSTVAAAVARAKAEVNVQKARTEQIRRQLEAEVIEPAKATCEAQEAQAKATCAPIVENGRARAEALLTLAESWTKAGGNAREIFLLQKIEPIIRQLTATISDSPIQKVTIIDSTASGGDNTPAKLFALNEQIKEVFGIDVAEKLKALPTERLAGPRSELRPPVLEGEN